MQHNASILDLLTVCPPSLFIVFCRFDNKTKKLNKSPRFVLLKNSTTRGQWDNAEMSYPPFECCAGLLGWEQKFEVSRPSICSILHVPPMAFGNQGLTYSLTLTANCQISWQWTLGFSPCPSDLIGNTVNREKLAYGIFCVQGCLRCKIVWQNYCRCSYGAAV